MSYSLRHTHSRLAHPRLRAQPAPRSWASWRVLIVLAAFGGYYALANDTTDRAQSLWDRTRQIAGYSTSPAALPAGKAPAPTISFGICAFAPHSNCVIDGDTFYLGNDPIRIADIDAPETHPSRCTREAALGERATQRLQQLLNSGRFVIRPYERDTDQYGRKLRVLERDGRSLGGALVSEGLARPWEGRRQPWC